jgi:asparagine synthase (glutamine-hydrolysing)
MCGICGIFDYGSHKDVDQGLLRKMCDTIIHRGPDDEGYYTDGNIGLGMRRLSIIDLHTGQQPIHNELETVWVVNNGEIYNFQSLREDLEQKGHRFYTKSDTEVIVHLYEEYGTDCVHRLRGMFAFAIWDADQKRLFLARDRLGKKPLSYTLHNGTLIFGSEIKCILEHPSISKKVNLEALDSYLTYQYVPGPASIFQGIEKLLPGHYLTCDRSGNVHIQQYWDIDFRDKWELTEEELCTQIREKLKEATKIRMISDVPLGAFLSGGIDSSAVVGLMSEVSSTPVKTFSIGFEEAEYSELAYARQVADLFGTDHTEFIVKPQMVEVLEKLMWHYGEPYADSSAFPSYYLAKETRKFVTVALCGDGGDENFAGYLRYPALRRAHTLARLYRAMGGKAINAVMDLIPDSADRVNFIRKAKKASWVFVQPPEDLNIHWYSFFNIEQKDRLYSDRMKNFLSGIDAHEYMASYFRAAPADQLMDKLLYADMKTYLPEDLLVKMDIATMANSLEVRSPFLDHEFMEFTAKIPFHLKLRGSTLKYILKKSLKGFLPENIMSRHKMGFGLPIIEWFRVDLKDYIRDILLSEESLNRGYFERAYIQGILDEHIFQHKNHANRIWALLMLELWHRSFNL